MKFKNYFFIISFLIAGLLVVPVGIIPYPKFFSTSIHLFSLSTISSLALCYILFNFQKLKNSLAETPLFTISILFIFFIAIIHFFIFENYEFDAFSLTLLWITVPLFIYLFNKEISKILPIYITILWILNFLVSFFVKGREDVGFVGNRNWHASFLVIGLLFYYYIAFRAILYIKGKKQEIGDQRSEVRSRRSVTQNPKPKTQQPTANNQLNLRAKHNKNFFSRVLIIIIYAVSILLTIYTCYLFYLCQSRAAVIAVILMIIVFCIYKLFTIARKNTKKTIINNPEKTTKLISFVIVILFVSFFISFLYIKQNNNDDIRSEYNPPVLTELITNLQEDVRIPLWTGCLNLILDHPLLGTGVNRFESIFATYRPIDYFSKPNNAVRSNHPHNTLLYIAAILGIPGLIFWSILWIYPLIFCLISFVRLSNLMKVVVLSYFCLFFHGFLDLTLFHWPTLYIAAILLGLLWRETWNGELRITNYELRNTNYELRNTKYELRNTNYELRIRNTTNHHLSKVLPDIEVSTSKNILLKKSKQKKVNHKKLETRNENSKSKTQNPKLTTLPPPTPRLWRTSLTSYLLPLLTYSIATIILILTIINVYNTYCSSINFTYGQNFESKKNNSAALYYYQKGLKYKKVPKFIYKAGMLSTMNLDNPKLALYFFNMLNEISFQNYAHSNAFTALNLIKLGKEKAALPYFIKEVVNYPLSTGAWYKLYLIQKKLGMEKSSKFAFKNMQKSLYYKGLSPKALSYLLKNPKYDNHPDRIPVEKLKELRIKN